MFPAWTWVVGFALGAVIGSFLNVVIYRTPRGISLSNPKNSFCPSCKHRLEVLDLVPLLSWAFLGGKCRHCGQKVSSRYFFVELLNGSIWAGVWYQQLIVGADPAKAVAYAAAASTLVAIIFIDWELYIIPDQINAFLFAVGIGLNVWMLVEGRPEAWTWGIPSALAGWIVGVATLWGIALFGRLVFRKDAMGHGDIKMARGIGAVLFPATALMGFGLAVVLGAILGIIQILLRKPEPNQSAEAAWLPDGASAATRDLAKAYREANPEGLAEASAAVMSSIRADLAAGPSPKARRDLEALAGQLERKPDLWINLAEDEEEIRISDRLLVKNMKAFEDVETEIVARRWRAAEAKLDALSKLAANPGDQSAVERMKDCVRARRRYVVASVESIGSLLKSGVGYFLCIDIVGLFVPKLYESWFGEPAFEPIEEVEEYPIERTMIPFGPYLALGAIVATVFQAELRNGVDRYVRWVTGPAEGLEQSSGERGQ